MAGSNRPCPTRKALMATGYEVQLYRNVDRIATALEKIAKAVEQDRAVIERLAEKHPTEEEQTNASNEG